MGFFALSLFLKLTIAVIRNGVNACGALIFIAAMCSPVHAQVNDIAIELNEFGELPFETLFIEDESALLSFDDINKQFHRGYAATAPFGSTAAGYTDSVIWHKFSLYNSSTENIAFVVAINDSMVGSFQVFEERLDEIVKHEPNGLTNHPARVLDYRTLAYSFSINAGESVSYYVRSQSLSSLSYDFSVRSFERHNQLHLSSVVVLSVYLGVILALFFYNLFLYFGTRGDVSYLLYCCSILMLSGVLIGINGWLGLFLVRYPWLVEHHLPALFFLANIFNIWFASYFLKVKAHAVWAHKLAIGYGAINTMCLIFSCFFLTSIIYQLSLVLSFFLPVLCLLAAVFSVFQGSRSAILYLLAWSSFFVLAIFGLLAELNLVESDIDEDFVLLVAHGAEALLMSFALAYRINVLQVEKSKAATSVLLAEERSLAKSLYFSEMSHELRTPMSGVLGMTELLKDTDLSEEQYRYVHIIHSSSKSLISIVNDILDMSKIEAGKIELDQIGFVLADIIDDMGDMFSHIATEKGLSFTASIEPTVPQNLVGDPARLRQVLVNLVNNAFKFTDRGEVGIRVFHTQNSSDAVTLVFEVSDTGIGLTDKAQESIFEPYIQAAEGAARRFGGTGLGLSICRQIVELMGGNIVVTSRVGKGAVFSFSILFGIAQSSALKRERSDDLKDDRLAGMRLLVISSSMNVRAIIKEQAQSWGVDVSCADEFEAGADLVGKSMQSSQPYDFVLLEESLVSASDEREGKRYTILERICSAGVFSGSIVLLGSSHDRIFIKDSIIDGVRAQCAKPLSMRRLRRVLLEVRPLSLSEGVEELRQFPEAFPRSFDERLGLADSYRSLRVLIAEDNIVNQMVITGLMRWFEMEFTIVGDGEEARQAIASDHDSFDLILMDINMPRLNGVESARQIRAFEKDKGLTEIPIVALSGDAEESSQKTCLDAGMQAFLLKPYTKESLVGIFLNIKK